MPIMKWPNPDSVLVGINAVIWYRDTKVSENPAAFTFRAETLYTLKMKATISCGQVVPTKLCADTFNTHSRKKLKFRTIR